ncbi:MAG: hypothetical protein HKO59_01140 [Phycisphaerales bacterium]|nr:hypothetical protein [Phycisphaerae bacterium]NNF41634.1 hypothetical protein [Phycisphaerales bacterium]NNM24584.1 hypothetical protein [Phycisphaerales bacterium]
MFKRIPMFILLPALVPMLGTVTHGQCVPFDFEGFAEGVEATSLVPGVTITCEPESCGPGVPLPEIYELVGGSGLPTKVVSPREGCPGASPDSLLLTFDENQSFIEFNLGSNATGGDIRIRWFNEFGTPLGTRFYAAGSGVDVLVTIEGPPIIRSVDVWQTTSSFEYIDNLRFGADETNPTVELTSPDFDACVCGDSTVGIMGSVSDDDGVYDCDVAEYRPINADESDPWTQFGFACGPFTGTLHTLNTVGLAEGRYYVRITGTNECGLSASDLTVIRVDRSFGTIALAPVATPLCGIATIEGGVSDRCGVSWDLEYRPAAGGAWIAIASGDSSRECEVADWDTTAVADGLYELRLSGVDGCGHADERTIMVEVANADGCGCTADINGDGVVDFVDLLLVLAQWTF